MELPDIIGFNRGVSAGTSGPDSVTASSEAATFGAPKAPCRGPSGMDPHPVGGEEALPMSTFDHKRLDV